MKTQALVAAFAALATALPAAAAVETYTIDPRHTFPSFEVMHFGVSLQRGRFNKTSGTVKVDTEARQGSVEVTIDATSVDTGLDKLEEHVRDEHSTFTWLLEPMIEKAGFEIEQAEYSDDGILASYLCRKPVAAQ